MKSCLAISLAVVLSACATSPRQSNEEWPWHQYYPPAALEQGIAGSATVDCGVRDDGTLDCVVVEETPTGWGFGEAVLAISQHFRVRPEERATVLDANGRLRRTTSFVPPSRR